MNRCQAESYCKGFPKKCNEFCIGYVQMQNIYDLSHIPLRYQFELPLIPDPKDKGEFMKLRDFQLNVEDHIKEGHGLFIYSKTKGNGKTSWACKIMNEYFRKIAMTNNLRCRGLFVNVPEFMDRLRDNMDESSSEVREFCQEVMRSDLVIWDDIGTENPSKWVRQTLYKYINYRESNAKSQIFTSNVPLLELVKEEYLGERVVNRIKGQCKIIEFVGESRREANW